MPNTLAFLGTTVGWTEVVLLLVLGLLIFGRRLPEVGKSLGRGIVEFKKGLAGIEDDIDNAGTVPPSANADNSSDPAKLDAGNSGVEVEPGAGTRTETSTSSDSTTES